MRKKDKKQLQEEKDLMILASEETIDFRGISREIGFSYAKVLQLKKELSEQELNKILANFKSLLYLGKFFPLSHLATVVLEIFNSLATSICRIPIFSLSSLILFILSLLL